LYFPLSVKKISIQNYLSKSFLTNKISSFLLFCHKKFVENFHQDRTYIKVAYYQKSSVVLSDLFQNQEHNNHTFAQTYKLPNKKMFIQMNIIAGRKEKIHVKQVVNETNTTCTTIKVTVYAPISDCTNRSDLM
jgi:hypothetical protein